MCFVQNFVDGEKLQYVDASKLPEMGVTDWEHIKVTGIFLYTASCTFQRFRRLSVRGSPSLTHALPPFPLLHPAANFCGHSNALAAERTQREAKCSRHGVSDALKFGPCVQQ